MKMSQRWFQVGGVESAVSSRRRRVGGAESAALSRPASTLRA